MSMLIREKPRKAVHDVITLINHAFISSLVFRMYFRTAKRLSMIQMLYEVLPVNITIELPSAVREYMSRSGLSFGANIIDPRAD